MHPIQVQNAPVRLQRTLPPLLKLVGQALIEPTDGTADFEQLLVRFELLLLPSGCSSLPRTSASG